MEEKITALVQTYNASKYLDRVLSSLKDFDELLVVDMESTDSTLDIARRHGARVITYPRGQHRIVEAYRDKAIHEASNPWVLVMDADEVVTPELRDYLYSEINRDSTPRGYALTFKNFFMGKFMKCMYPDYKIRFFHKDVTTWPTEIHSQPRIDGPVIKVPKKRMELATIHLANDSIASLQEKASRYTDSEVPRRRRKYRPIKIITGPFFRFFKTYILKGGILEGYHGLVKAMMDGYYRFLIMAKLEEERQNEGQRDIDQYLK